MIGDPQDASLHVILEAPSEAGVALLIAEDGIKKFALGFVNKPDSHGASPLFGSTMAKLVSSARSSK